MHISAGSIRLRHQRQGAHARFIAGKTSLSLGSQRPVGGRKTGLQQMSKWIRPIIKWLWRALMDLLPSKWHVAMDHYRINGKFPNLRHPRTLNEKISYRKLYDRDARMPALVDKLAVKEYMATRFGLDFVIPALATFESEKEIDFTALPYPCVIKANHGSSLNVFLKERPANEAKIRRRLRGFLRHSYHKVTEEWAYSQVPRRLLVEPLIDGGEYGLDDYKFHTFDGRVFAIEVVTDRYTEHAGAVFDPDWNEIPAEMGNPRSSKYIPRPRDFDKMLRYAKEIGEGFSYVRVDFYEINGKAIFGEITFYPGGGLDKIKPAEYDEIFGRQWSLKPPLPADFAMIEQKVRKVLVYRLGSLGDTVVALPCLHLIARKFPQAERVLLTNFPTHAVAAASATVLGDSGLIHRYMRYTVGTRRPAELLRLAWQIRRLKPDLLVYMMNVRPWRDIQRDWFFFRLAGLRRAVGFRNEEGHTHLFNPDTGLWESEAARLGRLIDELGDVNVDDLANWSLRLTSPERAAATFALGSLARKPLIVCGPGTKMQAKDWGQENWKALITRLALEYPEFGLAMVGAEEDAAMSDFVAEQWTGPKINLCGKLTPRETAAVFEHASVFLGPDSGPMHLAAIARVPCVIAFAARRPPGIWFPVGSQHQIIYHQTSCFDCKLQTCVVEARRCLSSITVDEMAAAVSRALGRVEFQQRKTFTFTHLWE